MAWKQNGKGPDINWIQQTANVLGSNDKDDLLVMYHDKPNGVKKVITEGHKPGYGTANEKGTADAIMMVCLFTFTISSQIQDYNMYRY